MAKAYSKIFWDYFTALLIISGAFCFAIIAFLRVQKLVDLSKKALDNVLMSTSISLVQILFATTIVLSVNSIVFDISYAGQLVLIALFGFLTAAMQAPLLMYMPPLNLVPRTMQN